jgi:DNA polymerase-3 subunit delta'
MPLRDVIGHRRLVRLLAEAVHRDTLPPSLILAGPAGVGKHRIALAIAQLLNCPSPIAPQPHGEGDFQLPIDACGVCSCCIRIVRGVHPDVLTVVPGETGNIRIEQVRDVIDRAGYRPFEGRLRVVIIDDADALMPAAQNALLKTLEEPPSRSIFFLVTSRPDMLLPTVRSRCPLLRFRPLGAAEVAAALMAQGRAEDEARAVAAVAEGSIGQAIEANADRLVEAREIASRLLAHAARTTDPRRRLESAKELIEKTGSGSAAADREQVALRLRALASLLRDIELLSTRADRRALANPDVQPALEPLSMFRGERGLRAFTAVDRALVALDRNAGVKAVADWVVLQL